MRNRVFHTLAALDEAIMQYLRELNQRRMRKYDKSRAELFESLERAALLPLPTHPFEITEWKRARVNIDYHLEFDDRLYSVPHCYGREHVWVYTTSTMVEVQLRGRRIAIHPRHGSRYSTVPEHMPSAHRQHADWSPSRRSQERLEAEAGLDGRATGSATHAKVRRFGAPRRPSAFEATF